MRLVGQAVLEGGRSMDPARLASMTKRLACAALQSGVGEVMGLLASLDRLLRSASVPPFSSHGRTDHAINVSASKSDSICIARYSVAMQTATGHLLQSG